MVQGKYTVLKLIEEEEFNETRVFYNMSDWKYATKTKEELLNLLVDKIMKEQYEDCRLIRYQLLRR